MPISDEISTYRNVIHEYESNIDNCRTAKVRQAIEAIEVDLNQVRIVTLKFVGRQPV